MDNKISICPNCKLEQSCPGESSNLCLYCMEHEGTGGWHIFLFVSFIIIGIFMMVFTKGWWFLSLIITLITTFGPPFLFLNFKKRYYNYLIKKTNKKPLFFIRNPDTFLSILLLYSTLAIVPITYFHFYPEEKVKFKIRAEFSESLKEYKKTHDVCAFQDFVNNNKDSINMVSEFLIENEDSSLIYQYKKVKSIINESLNNLSSDKNYRLTDKFILFVKYDYPYVPENEKDEKKSFHDLFYGFQPVEISKVIEKQKSVVYIFKSSVATGTSYFSNNSYEHGSGSGYRWKYVVYVIDLINKKTIAYNEYLGDLPPSRAYVNSGNNRVYGSEPEIYIIESWYLNYLPLK